MSRLSTLGLAACVGLSTALFVFVPPLGGAEVNWPEASRDSPAESYFPGFQVAGSGGEPDENWRWRDGFSLPVLDGRVHAFTIYRGDLVAAGDFEMAGGQRVNRVARWKDGNWQPLGAGFDGEVYALAVFQGRLIAGCRYTSSGGRTVGPVASWDGIEWASLGAPVSGWVSGVEVRALLVDGASLIAGGAFDWMAFLSDSGRVEQIEVSNIARWDGSAWSAIGAGLDGPVNALGSYRGELVAAGDFMNSGATSATRIASWNGTAWSPVGEGIACAQYCRVRAVAEMGDTLYAGGLFEGQGTLLRFGGATWDTIPGSRVGEARALLVEGDSLIVVGSLRRVGEPLSCVQAWNGANWSQVGQTPWPIAEAVTRHQGRLVVGGYLTSVWAVAGEPASHVIAWNGTDWETFEQVRNGDHGLLGYVAALSPDPEGVVAAGSFRFMTPQGWSPTQLVARWDGIRWHSMTGSLTGRATCLAVLRGELVVGGNLFDNSSGVQGIARWDGLRWLPLGDLEGGVEALAVLRDTLYVTGYLSSNGLSSRVAWFGGAGWHPILRSAGGSSSIGTVGIHRGEIYIGGNFESVDGIPARNVARWDGASWTALRGGVSGSVNAFASVESALVVAGGFYEVDGEPIFGVATWNGSEWAPFPGIVASNARAILATRGQVFVAADLLVRQAAPGVPSGTYLSKIARWDGGEWHSLGVGANGHLVALAESGNDLFVGGNLTEAGGKASFRLARWALAPRASLGASPLAWEAVMPNPFSTRGTRLEFSLAEASYVRLSIHDIAGREVARPVSGSMAPGIHVVQWVGKDGAGRRLPSGIYFARLASSEGSVAVKRLILVE